MAPPGGRQPQDWTVQPRWEGLMLYGSASRPAARHASLRDDMWWLLSSEEGQSVSDVDIEAPQKPAAGGGGGAGGATAVPAQQEEVHRFPAHKAVLATRSVWFRSALTGGGGTSAAAAAAAAAPPGRRDAVTLPVAASPAAVQSLLCWLYCATLGRRQMGDDDLRDLHSLADALDLPRLRLLADELRPCTLLEAQQQPGGDGCADERVSFYQRMRSETSLPRAGGGSAGSSYSDATQGLSSAGATSPATPPDASVFFGHTPPNLSGLSGGGATPVSPPLMAQGPPAQCTWRRDLAALGGGRPSPAAWDGADCVLSCDGVEARVSTALLVARSDFHQRVFGGEWSPELHDGVRSCDIDSDTIDPQALPDLVRFLAEDTLSFIARSERDFERVYRLAEMAEYWMIDHLFARCQAWLTKFACPENVAPLWNVAAQIRATQTCDACRDIVVGRFGECAEAADFVELEKEHLKAALDCGKILSPAHVIFAAIERWAKHQLTRDIDGGDSIDVPPEAINALIHDLMPPCTMFNRDMRRAVLGLSSRHLPPGMMA